jgi:activator of HSP90 ATPase
MEKAISKTYAIKAPVSKVWTALVSPELIRRWSGAKAIMHAKPDTRFELWGGDIYGRNVEAVKNKKLVQEWYGGRWAEPSLVIITLTPIPVGTRVHLEQKNVPPEEYAAINKGWDDYYFEPIKELVER